MIVQRSQSNGAAIDSHGVTSPARLGAPYDAPRDQASSVPKSCAGADAGVTASGAVQSARTTRTRVAPVVPAAAAVVAATRSRLETARAGPAPAGAAAAVPSTRSR